ncbi:MAG: hypothetical protein VXZ73_00340 [Pseudomonadota bacterium]|nr:hypothetical protein [Pseudomonadota bacterium]
MRSTLRVIYGKNSKNSIMDSWSGHVQDTGLFLSSLVPANCEKLFAGTPIAIDSICFDAPMRIEVLDCILNRVLVAQSRIALLDFGVHDWSLDNLMTFLGRLHNIEHIRYLKLGEARFSLDAWRALGTWLNDHGVTIESLDLGAMSMSLPRVQILSSLCASQSIALDKLDFGSSLWDMTHMRAFMWAFANDGYGLKRVSLSAMTCSAVGLELLIHHMLCLSESLTIFSTGVTILSDKALDKLLTAVLRAGSNLQACIISSQSFNANNTKLLWDIITHAKHLKRMALMDCQWYQHVLDESVQLDSSLSLPKLYLEHQSCPNAKQLITMLENHGYVIEKQLGEEGSRVWLKLSN